MSGEYDRFWNENSERLRRYHYISPYLDVALERYVKNHVPPGDFLRACLENDFKGAMAHADDKNRLNMYNIFIWICNAVPIEAQGSPEKVRAWIVGYHIAPDLSHVDNEYTGQDEATELDDPKFLKTSEDQPE